MRSCPCGWQIWLFAAVAFLGLGLALEFWPESPRFSVQNPHRELVDLPAEKPYPLSFLIKNLGADPMRVVGAEYS